GGLGAEAGALGRLVGMVAAVAVGRLDQGVVLGLGNDEKGFGHGGRDQSFLTGTSGLTWAMGFSPFTALSRFCTEVVAWRTTLSKVREATWGVTTTFGSLSSGWSAGGGSWSSTSVP